VRRARRRQRGTLHRGEQPLASGQPLGAPTGQSGGLRREAARSRPSARSGARQRATAVLGRSLQGQGELQRKGSGRGVGRSVVRGGVSAVRRSSQMHGSRHRQASGTKSTQRHRETDRELGVGKDRDFVTVAGGGGSCPAHPSACSSRCPGQWASGACTGRTQPSLAATPAPARGWAHRWPRACSRCERPPVCLCAPVAPPWWAAASATAATAAAWRTQASGRPRRHANQTAGSGALAVSALAKCSEGGLAAARRRPAESCAARIAVL
jgi:hypothetical protein